MTEFVTSLFPETNANKHTFAFGTLYAYIEVSFIIALTMTDIDFIRLSALVFATRLIGKTADPVSEGMEMAERLFNKLKQKEVE